MVVVGKRANKNKPTAAITERLLDERKVERLTPLWL